MGRGEIKFYRIDDAIFSFNFISYFFFLYERGYACNANLLYLEVAFQLEVFLETLGPSNFNTNRTS